MKLKSIFKRKEKIHPKSNVQPLDKKQLEKVIGGVESVVGKSIPIGAGTSGTTN